MAAGNRIKAFFRHVRVTNHRDSHIFFSSENNRYAAHMGYRHGFACKHCSYRSQWYFGMINHLQRKHGLLFERYSGMMREMAHWTEGKFNVDNMGQGVERQIARIGARREEEY